MAKDVEIKWVEDLIDHEIAEGWESIKRDQAMDETVNKAIALLRTGDAYFRQKAYEAAFVPYDMAIKMFEVSNLTNGTFWFKMGLAFRTIGKSILEEWSKDSDRTKGYQKAIKCFKKAIEMSQNFKEAWLVLAFCYNKLSYFYQKTEKHQKQIECLQNQVGCLEKVIEIDPRETKRAGTWLKSTKIRLDFSRDLWSS